MRYRILVLALALSPATLAGQGRQCVFAVDHVGREGQRSEADGTVNYFAGGGVRLRCQSTSVKMSSDSLASFGGRVVQFIGNVRYEDSTIVMTADRGTYFKDGERWEARGHVVTQNKNGSTLRGPSLDYFRVVPGIRDTLEIYSIGRPTIHYATQDSTEAPAEPYVIVGDRVRMKGNDRIWAGGAVTIDRSDFAAKGDSMALDTGPSGAGVLVGSPEMRGLGRDSFRLTGRRLDLTLQQQQLTYIKALGDGHAVSRDMDLVADTIGLDFEAKALIQTLAWGDSIRPRALAAEYEVRGDSVAFDTPGQHLREVRSFQHAWVGGAVDSASQERDWLSGDSVVASFTTVDSAGTPRTALDQLQARGSAHSFYRVANQKQRGGLPSINYSTGQSISVRMKTGARRGVERVDIRGQVDGIHLEPLEVPVSDSTAPAPNGPKGSR